MTTTGRWSRLRAAVENHPASVLAARHLAVFRAAWMSRHQLVGPKRLADEQAFLPAALSLQETPPHPAPRRAALVVCAVFAVACAWAWLGEIDIMAIAPGRIVVAERSKVVQPLETAVVRSIHVRDGETVQAGQLLVELDPTASEADSGRLAEERRAAQGEALRTQGLLASLTSEREPRVASSPATVDDWRAQDQADAAVQLQAEWLEHRARLAKLDAEQARRRAQLETARQVVIKLKATVPLARQRESDYRGLTEQGFMSGHAGQDRTRERIELERDLATSVARIAEDQASLDETRRSRAAYLAEARRNWHDRAAQARRKLAELAQEHTKANQRSALTRMTAPVSGTVQQLAIHTPGGVVTPAQPLMVIVPTAAAGEAIAEVHIENKDIGFVRSGQSAEVKFETFNFTRYGTVAATVQWVTADAVVQPVAGVSRGTDADLRTSASPGQAVFPARLLLTRADLMIDGKTVRLSPGLNLTAEVKIGRRRLIDYLLSPVQKTIGESLRER